jgi:two-component system cell cycle sensor histidine kinase/response regulator CckA
VADKVSQDNSTDNRPKILIVDDDTEVVHYLRTLLASSYRIIYRFDAESALKATREEEPSLILSDVVMPGMDGPSWVRLALETRPDTRVIFVSGYAEDALTEMQARIPNSVFLPKPFSLSELAATVQGQMLH